ncbi:eukaryotic translation initiation factor 5B [Forsythia ovata]|uniref:Eukaryotic translation initiation factor 5B n=1 Tax=Forsythia ovata TaxID=205694 RepID=A0ABD1SR71_9LAMI
MAIKTFVKFIVHFEKFPSLLQSARNTQTKKDLRATKKKRLTTDSKPKSVAPPAAEKNSEDNPQSWRSSCTLPATSATSMATMIEQKLVNAVSSYEPLVLTRCKSKPMKTVATKLMLESCFWKNVVQKLEPHRRATVGGIPRRMH